MTEWSDMSYSLYLIDELPQLSNNTFIYSREFYGVDNVCIQDTYI